MNNKFQKAATWLGGIALIALIAILALNYWLLPLIFETSVSEAVRRKWGVTVSCSSISIIPFRGVTFKDLIVMKRDDRDPFVVRIASLKVVPALVSGIKDGVWVKRIQVNDVDVRLGSSRNEFIYAAGMVRARVRREGEVLKAFIAMRNVRAFERSFNGKAMASFDTAAAPELHGIFTDGGITIYWSAAGKTLRAALLSDRSRIFVESVQGKERGDRYTGFRAQADLDELRGLTNRLWPFTRTVDSPSSVDVRGYWDARGWSRFQLASRSLGWHKVPFENVKLGILFNDEGECFLTRFSARICSGMLSGRSWLRSKHFHTFSGRLKTRDINMEELSRLVWTASHVVQGRMSAQAAFLGVFSPDAEDVIRGLSLRGAMEIVDGHLWDIEIMKGILKVFKPIVPSMHEISFTSGKARFYIGGGILHVERLKLMSKVVMLSIRGRIGLRDAHVRGKVEMSINSLGLKRKTFLGKIISAGLTLATREAWKARISGTLSNPDLKPQFLPVLEPVIDAIEKPFKMIKEKVEEKT